MAFMVPIGAISQISGTGEITGTVTDQTRAVVPNATVTATAVETNVKTVRSTTDSGVYDISPLPPGVYTVTFTAKGFEKYVQENVTVDALQTVSVNVKLTIGGGEDTITVTDAPPTLDTADAQLGAVMDNEMYTSLPLLMGASGQPDQRRATDFAYLMPGVQNTYAASANGNPTDDSGSINGGNPAGGTSEIYIDGVNLTEGDGVGDPRFTWSAIGLDAIDQFQVESAGYPAQYAGQGVQNYSVKQGGNNIHGSLYEYIRNTALDAWSPTNKLPTSTGALTPPGGMCKDDTPADAAASVGAWCKLGGIKPAEQMNEFGIVISGPIVKNKLFLFYNYGQYRYNAGPKYQVQTVPLPTMMGYTSAGGAQGYADFSGYAVANGTAGCTVGTNCYDVYDPGTQTTPNCTGAGCKRTVFPGDQIPSSRFSAASAYFNKIMFAMPQYQAANFNLFANNVSVGYASGLSNWYQTGRLDYTQSEKNQVSLIIGFGRQSVKSQYGVASGAANSLPPPFNTNQFYAPTTNVDILKDTYTINSHMVNQLALAYGRYESIDSNPDHGSQYSPASSGLLNTPPGQPSIGMPGIAFSGGQDVPQNEANYNWHGQDNNTYTAMDNLQWESGKHNVTFGGQMVQVQFNNWTTTGATPLQYTFASSLTNGYSPTGSSLTAGSTFASYMLGAVSASSVSINPEWGARWNSPSLWVQDNYKVTSKLTLNLGVRWDVYASIHENHNQWSWLNPTGINFNTGNHGVLAFAGGTAGDGAYTGLHSPSPNWYKNVEPRVGLAYALDHKTVIRTSFTVTAARGDWTAGGGGQKLPSQSGLVPSASAAPGVSGAPSFYWDASACASNANGLANDGFTPCGWTGSTSSPSIVIAQQIALGNMPAGANLAEFGTSMTATEKNANSITAAYWDPYLGSRSPEYINWTFGIQRELTKNMTVTATYVGSEGHFISVANANGSRNNGLPESMAALAGYTLTASGGTTQVPCSGNTCLYTVLGQKATPAYLAMAVADGFTPPNPYTNPGSTGTGGYYASNAVYQYYEPFPQYNKVSDQTSNVGNENWHALEVSARQRLSAGLNFMVNYTWSKGIDDLGTFRVGDNDRLDRSISAANQPQSLVATVVYQLPFGRGHRWGDNFVYRSVVSDWTISGIGLYHSGLPILVTGSGCGSTAILGQCMPSVVKGQPGRVNAWGKSATGSAISFDPGSPNYIGLAANQYLNPAAFNLNGAGTTATYGTTQGQVTFVGNGPALYVPGNAARAVPIQGLYTQPTFNADLALKRTFPLYRNIKLAFEIDMTNVTNDVVLAGPSAQASKNSGTFGIVSKVANQPRDVQGAARISW